MEMPFLIGIVRPYKVFYHPMEQDIPSYGTTKMMVLFCYMLIYLYLCNQNK